MKVRPKRFYSLLTGQVIGFYRGSTLIHWVLHVTICYHGENNDVDTEWQALYNGKWKPVGTWSHSIELFIEANFVHSNYGVHRWGFRKKYNPKKIGKSIWSKTTSKMFETREKYLLKFIKLKLAGSQIFRNIFFLIQYCKYLNNA